ncbi:MAG TPA: hypothetical protein PLE77_04920 [Kiritimatiellia bacterium]|mgnify:CR=1 FL=1|nr:hypothetical protein [Kiritimatiellia bacterium]
MHRIRVLPVGFILLAACAAWAGQLLNTGFETDFGQRDQLNVWGEFGDRWGEAYQVNAGGQHIARAKSGSRVLVINIPPNSWNGVWQQIPWKENAAFAWEGSYLIRGGDLPKDCMTFLKVEFYDAGDALLGMVEGDHHSSDTKGKWVKERMHGTTPAGTAAIRFIVIGGGNAGGQAVTDRIYWDDVDTMN